MIEYKEPSLTYNKNNFTKHNYTAHSYTEHSFNTLSQQSIFSDSIFDINSTSDGEAVEKTSAVVPAIPLLVLALNNVPQEIAPSIWLGSYNVLLNSEFFDIKNIKIIINCSPTNKFVKQLDNSKICVPSDMVILSLDPSFSADKILPDEQFLLLEYIMKFNKVLQNYINHFYKFNPNSSRLIHQIPNEELSIQSPILSGNLKQHLFNINRLIKLLKNINDSIEVLVLSEDGNSQLSTALSISYLMDNYNYNLEASFGNLRAKRPSVRYLNHNYYEDLLIIENLKKFYQENFNLKSKTPGLLTANCKLKRRNDDENDYLNLISCGEVKRRFKYPKGLYD